MTLCPVLCSNEIKARLKCRLLSAQRSLEHLWTFLVTFRSLRKVVRNL